MMTPSTIATAEAKAFFADAASPTASEMSARMVPSGSSAMMVMAAEPALSLLDAMPPNLRKSFAFKADAFPVPITIRRSAFRPSGARMSRAAPLLPLNEAAAAARFTSSLAPPSALAVAGPSFRPSSQNTTRMPRAAEANGTKPTLMASDMGNSSRTWGFLPVGDPGQRSELNGDSLDFPHYGPQARPMPSAARGREATTREILTIY